MYYHYVITAYFLSYYVATKKGGDNESDAAQVSRERPRTKLGRLIVIRAAPLLNNSLALTCSTWQANRLCAVHLTLNLTQVTDWQTRYASVAALSIFMSGSGSSSL